MKLRGIFSGPEMQPFLRFAAIVLSVCLVECLVVLFAKKPLPWTGFIAATVPLFVVVLIVIPMIRGSKSGSKG
jgi:hypothetical protein